MKKLGISKGKKFNKTKAKRKLDKLFSLKIRSYGKCLLAKGFDKVHCGGQLQTAHIIGRSNLRLRWDLGNAWCICAGHHIYYTYHPEDWRDLLTAHYPHYKWLLEHRNETIKFNEQYYLEKLKELT